MGGTADAWVEIDGEVIIYDLQPGEILRVHPGHVGMFQAQIPFDIATVPGIKNKIFGGTACSWPSSPGRDASGSKPSRSPVSPARCSRTWCRARPRREPSAA